MSCSANDIINKIMEKAIDTSGLEKPSSALKRFHVSQTAEQLPDLRLRNAFYRAELERQIADKKEMERRRRERDVFDEERLFRKIETDREKLRREYVDEIDKRRILQEEAVKRQQAYAKKLEEIHEEEGRKKEEEDRKRQQAILEKRIAELQEAVEKKKIDDVQKRKVMMEQIYGMRYPNPYNALGFDEAPMPVQLSRVLPARLRGGSNNGLNNNESDWDYYKRPWNSRDYVHSALHSDNLMLEDVYFEAPLPMLADVYKKLDGEKKRIKDIMRQRIIQGEKW